MDSSIIVPNSADRDFTVLPNRFNWVIVSSMSLDVTWGLCSAWRVACESVKMRT